MCVYIYICILRERVNAQWGHSMHADSKFESVRA